MVTKYAVAEGEFKYEMFLKPGELVRGGPHRVEGTEHVSWMGLVYPDGSMDAVSVSTEPDWLPEVSQENRDYRLRGQLFGALASYLGREILKSKGVTRLTIRQAVIDEHANDE